MASTDNMVLMLNKWGNRVIAGEKRIMKRMWIHRDGDTKDSVRTGRLIESLGFELSDTELVIEYDVPYAHYLDKGRSYNNGYKFKGIFFTEAEELFDSQECLDDFQKAFLKDFIKNVQQNKYK